MSIPKRFYFNNSTEMDAFVINMSHGKEYDNKKILSRVRSTFSNLNFHSGRAKYGKFSMTLDFTTGLIRLEYKNKNGRTHSRKVNDVIVRGATPFQQLKAILKLDINALRRMVRDDVLHYTGW